MRYCIEKEDRPEYLHMIVKYKEKNSTCINKTIESRLICLAVKKVRNLEWFKTIFDMYSKMNKVPLKGDFESALKNEYFENGISKECQEMIKENYDKFYPK